MKRDKSIFYFSLHNYLDRSSGAAISARSVLLALARSGWRVRVLCGTIFDDGERRFEDFISELRSREFQPTIVEETWNCQGVENRFRNVRFNDGGIESSVLWSLDASAGKRRFEPSREETELFLYRFEQERRESCSGVFMTYGGARATELGASYFQNHGVKTVFYLCNLAYRRRALFDSFDAIVVPSQFAAQAYKERLKLDMVVLPPLIEQSSILAPDREPRYLTFIAPTREKGCFFFADLVQELAHRRSDIPILIVQGRASLKTLAARLGRVDAANIKVLRGVVSPKSYYRHTRVLLAPSLNEESFGRIVVEAGMNGIPALTSDRGALPHTLGSGGFALSIPERFTPAYDGNSTRQELEPWIETISRLWDDENFYKDLQIKALLNSSRFDENKVATIAVNFFESLLNVN